MKICSKCDSNLDEYNISLGDNRLCRYCYSQYKNNRYKDPAYSKKVIARAKAMHAYKKGVIMKFDCATCGSSESEMHHPDYDKPLDVVWLCIPCHNEFHALERKVYALGR